ncbi:hypothetical protein FQN54_007438 [Arachnomyces sp. PD_36]|nr:hypothetical protein FQN54_007438 [Arachnomyces sp. PD_36]
MGVDAPCPPGRQLVSTSQGTAFDRPPDQWIPEELVQFGVVDTPNTGPPNIQGPIHTFFSQKCWPQLHHNTRRLQAMRPSLILATKLLKVSGPFIASFLPEKRSGEYDGRVRVNPVTSLGDIARAFQVLDEIAQQTKVREDESMWPNVGRHGVIIPTGSGIKPDEPVRDGVDAECWEQTTERDRDAGLRFRRLTIHLASQFGDTLESLASENADSEQYIQAAFMCAITLTHEIAHLVHASGFENYTWLGEPLVDGGTLMELGTSLIGWLFDGWIPENISLNPETRDDSSFKNGCCWYKQLREPRGYPQYHTLHSVPMAHIKRIFRAEEWAKFDENDPQFSVQVRTELLRPQVPFRAGETARIAWKRRAHRVDLSPALDPYSEIWDFHDPDWVGPSTEQEGGTIGASSANISLPTRTVSTSPVKVMPTEGLADLGPESSPSPKPGKDVIITKDNLSVVRSGKTDHQDTEQGHKTGISLSRPHSRDATPSRSPTSSTYKPNHSVKRSPRPLKISRKYSAPAASRAVRRSRRLLGEPAEQADGLPYPTRKRTNEGMSRCTTPS